MRALFSEDLMKFLSKTFKKNVRHRIEMSNSSAARFAAAASGGGGCVVARRRRRRRRCNDGCFSSGRGARVRLLDDDEDRFRRLRGKSLKAAKETVTDDDEEERCW